MAVTAVLEPRTINLALQGGGAHGAFTWGALDRLLEEERLEIEGISGTSAGAMNAAILKTGLLYGGREGARAQLDRFWGSIRQCAQANTNPTAEWLGLFFTDAARMLDKVMRERAYQLRDSFSRALSPYEWNPLNLNPLRDLLEEMIDFERVSWQSLPHLFFCATNVRTGKIRVFSREEITIDALLASACLPDMFQAVEIDGEHYWDGGYMGNPPLYPLFYRVGCRDVVIVHVNPIERPDVPQTARDIMNRINEISFNSSLLRELRAIAFVQRLIAEGRVLPGEMKNVLIHSIRDDATMARFSASTKLSPEPREIDTLKEAGRAAADAFLRQHWASIGVESTVNLRAMLD